MRFTVGYCLYPHGENNSIETRMRLIFDDGLPATELNRHLVMAQLNRDKPLGTTVYQLCTYLEHRLQPVSAEFMTSIPFSTFFIRKTLNCPA